MVRLESWKGGCRSGINQHGKEYDYLNRHLYPFQHQQGATPSIYSSYSEYKLEEGIEALVALCEQCQQPYLRQSWRHVTLAQTHQ